MPGDPEYAAWPGLAGLLDDWVCTARASWPSIDLSPSSFIAYVAERVEPGTAPQALAEIRIADVYLAFACVQGDTAALSQLERGYFRRLGSVVARIEPSRVDEVVSALRQSLLLPPDPGGGLARYAGRAELRTWLRICAVRAAVKARTRLGKEPTVEQSVLEAMCVPDALGGRPEVGYERKRFAADVQRAMEVAFAELGPDDKSLLMQHYVDGLTTGQLGRLRGLHRVSISRHLVRARRVLLAATREHLIRKLSLTDSECDSVLRALKSQLDITLERVLAPSPEGDSSTDVADV